MKTPDYKFMSIKNIALLTNIKENTFRYWISNEDCNGLSNALIRIGRRIFIDIDRFNEWIESHRE